LIEWAVRSALIEVVGGRRGDRPGGGFAVGTPTGTSAHPRREHIILQGRIFRQVHDQSDIRTDSVFVLGG